MTVAERTVVIGGGLAGARCALELRARGYAGEVTLVGDETHLPYERPQLSKAYLAGQRDFTDLLVAPRTAYETAGIELILDRPAIGVDPVTHTVRLANGAELVYANLVLATGSRARALPCPGAEPDRVHVLRTVEDAQRLAAHATAGGRVVVVGLGLIGAEVCATLVTGGLEVIAIAPESSPLRRIVGDVVGARLAALHRAHGITLLLGRQVRAVAGNRARQRVELDSGTSIDCDVVVAGIGAAPNTGIASDAKLLCASGILVDADGASAVPGIYAVGDVAEPFIPHLNRCARVEHWQAADRQGRRVAQVIAGTAQGHADDVPWFWSDQYDAQLQVLGWPDGSADTVIRGDLEELDFLAFHLRGGRVVAASGIGRARELRRAAGLIRSRVACSGAVLADPGIDLRELASNRV